MLNKRTLQKSESVPNDASGNRDDRESNEKKISRRRFFKKAAVGAVALAGTSELADLVASSVSEVSPNELYARDILAGEQALAEREYILMSDREKEETVQALIEMHRKQT